MIKSIDPIVRLNYQSYKPPAQQQIVKEVKELKKDLKSTGQLINIKV